VYFTLQRGGRNEDCVNADSARHGYAGARRAKKKDQPNTMKKWKAGVQIIGGWLFIGFTITVYVWYQRYLIESPSLLFGVVFGGAILGFLFSALEAALLSFKEADEKAMVERHAAEDSAAGTERKLKMRLAKKHAREKYVTSDRGYHVAPLIIFSNFTTILVAALIPSSFVLHPVIKPFHINIETIAGWLGLASPYLEWRWPPAGKGSLIFFSSSVVLIMLAKIIPKKVGGHPRCRFFLVTRCSRIIKIVSKTFGWLGLAINAPADFVLKLLGLKSE
jgi:hypothetical protein